MNAILRLCVELQHSCSGPRERYVTDDELAAVYAKARPMVQVAIDLAVLTGLQRGDLLSLTKDQLKDDGVHVRTSKTGRGLIIVYTPELSAVLERAKLLKPHFRQPLIAARAGKAFTGTGFATLWRRGRSVPEGARSRALHVQRSPLEVSEPYRRAL